MEQMSLGEVHFDRFRKVTRREIFLAKMQEVVPWVALTELIKPHYHVAGKVGRPPKALLMMTKI